MDWYILLYFITNHDFTHGGYDISHLIVYDMNQPGREPEKPCEHFDLNMYKFGYRRFPLRPDF